MAGRVQVRWENESAATPMGQLAYFIEFLTLTELWSRWLESCPLNYNSPNAPSKADVLGTWMLSVLAGHKRYSHVTAIRCDGVNPGLLGMDKVISEDALRNALKRIPEAQGTAWLDRHLSASVAPLLDAPWILDTDTTVKPLYGHQEGAVVSYNPRKPGRPSHSYHTYLMAGLRQVLGVEVRAGNEHAAKHTQPGLLKILDDETLIAFFIIEAKEDGSVYWHLTVVSPEFQGRGYGRRTWLAMLRQHNEKGHNAVSTTISARNISALNLYSSLSFRFSPPDMTFHWTKG